MAGPDTADPKRCVAAVAFYVFIASSLDESDHSPPCRRHRLSGTDEAKQFIDYTSYEPCEDFLELCAGTAPAACSHPRSAKRMGH
jgi:hypothetical protein